MPLNSMLRSVILGILAIATPLRADNLPPAPSYLGDIRRDESGRIVAVPAADPIPQEQSPQPAVSNPPARTAPPAELPTTRIAPAKAEKPAVTERKPPNCQPQALTCIEVSSTSDKPQDEVPVTFGQPFRLGDLPKGERLVGRDESGNAIFIQIDEESSYPDGSVRFAVLSTLIKNLRPYEQRIVSLFREHGVKEAGSRLSQPSASTYDLKLSANIYSPQISIVTFGNRNGSVAGYPFETGEQVTLVLGDTPEDRFTLSITAEQSGGDFTTLTKLADAFIALINSRSRNFRAYKPGPGIGFEKMWVTTRSVEGKAFGIRFIYGGRAKLSSEIIQEYRPPRRYEAAGKPALERVLASGKPARLDGPIAREYGLSIPFTEVGTGKKHPQLTARLHTRFYNSRKRIRTDMVLENAWAYEPEPGNVMYDLTVVQDNRVIYQQEPFTHYHHARWHKVLWSGEAPKVRLRHHMPYFLSSRATWNYDTSLGIPEKVLVDEAERLDKVGTQPMSPVFITTYFSTTGGRQDIGPLPRWTALFLITQDPRAERSMLANADAAAGIPIHYRDAATDQPVSLEYHPGLALQLGGSSAKDAVPAMRNDATVWAVDTSHQASFAYIPYLVSGDLFYQEEIMFWSNWNLGHLPPDYRGGAQGLQHPEQIRGQAWGLRSIGEAARALPDRHPMKSYFKKALENNLKWYVEHYPRNTDRNVASPLGFMEIRSSPGLTSTWQSDFLAIVVGQLAESGDSLAIEYFRWLSRFTVGRFLHENEGYCRPVASNYKYLKVRDESGRLIDSWGKLFKLNWPEIARCQPDIPVGGYPESAAGFAAYAKAMLSVAAGLEVEGAAPTFNWLDSNTPQMRGAILQDPTWAIVPRQPTKKRND